MKTELVTFHGCGGKTAERLLAAHRSGLTVREITHGDNGYPEPFEGEFFVSGFDSLDAANAFAKANDGEVGSADWKDGWGVVETFCPMSRTLSISDIVNPDSLCKNVKDERGFWNEELARAKAAAGGDEDDAGVQRAEKELASLADLADENIIVGGELYAREDGHMGLSYDNRNTEIGVRLVDEDKDEE